VTADRFRAQLLAGPPARSPVEVAERLLAVQAQDPRGFRLAVRARTSRPGESGLTAPGLTAADVDAALDGRALVVTWLNRGTLHLVTGVDYWWLHALTTPPLFTGNARRLAQEGVPPDDAERGVAAVSRALADGPKTRAELADAVAAAGVRTAGQALVHVLMLTCLRGIAVRGPMRGGHHAYVLVRDWLGTPPRLPDRDVLLRDLAARYLAGHAPAGDRDLAKWAGLPLRDARAGLAAAGAARPDSADTTEATAEAPTTLLGAFDPLLLGWATRGPVLGRYDSRVVSGGLFRPVALVRGRAAAIWRYAGRGAGGRVEFEPFGPLAPADRETLDADARDVERFLGSPA
jgi:hypothetical protein